MNERQYDKLVIGDEVMVSNGEEYSHFKNKSIVTVHSKDKYGHIIFEGKNGTRQYLLPEHITIIKETACDEDHR